MNIVLFEDNQCVNMRPAGLFSPMYELHVGSLRLYDIVTSLGHPVQTVVRDHFIFDGDGLPEFTSPLDEPYLFLNASIEPDVRYIDTIKRLIDSADPFVTTSGNRVAAALVPPGTAMPKIMTSAEVGAFLLELDLPLEHELFKTIDWPHEIVKSHLRHFEANLERTIAGGSFTEKEPGLFVGDGVTIGKFVSLNTNNGPVVIDDNVTILDFTYLEGPIYIGKHSRVIEHAAIKDMSSVGMGCKVGGEVEASIIEPRSNKQHHGFLGHSWVGRWVNLGAGTSTSDLKNTYGTVSMEYRGHRVATGMQFLGSIIGDYTKAAINTSLFTGKLVGTCSMIYGMVTTNVPSFTNYARSFGQMTEVGPGPIIKTQERVYARRDIVQTERDREMVRRVYDLTRNERVIRMDKISF